MTQNQQEAAPSETAYLRITRTGGAPCRKYGLWIDGVRVARIAHGQEDAVFDVTANQEHSFQARLDWERSKKIVFTLGPGQEKHIQVNFGRWFKLKEVENDNKPKGDTNKT